MRCCLSFCFPSISLQTHARARGDVPCAALRLAGQRGRQWRVADSGGKWRRVAASGANQQVIVGTVGNGPNQQWAAIREKTLNSGLPAVLRRHMAHLHPDGA